MATSSKAPGIKPGLLLTHDWSQLHTEKGLCDTTITKTDGQDYNTIVFPITKLSQYEAFVNGQVLCQDVTGCPSQSLGNVIQSEPSCHDKPISAVVKVIYQVTHTLSADQGSSLSADALTSLQKIDNSPDHTNNVPKFLQTYGSHFQYGSQQAGKAFSWMVLVDGECDMNLLRDIANQIFTVCEEDATLLPASIEGFWYSVQNLLSSASWSKEKKQLLNSLKLRVAQCGSSACNVDFVEWKSREVEGHVFRVGGVNTNVVSLWDLIDRSRKEFKNVQNLKSVMKFGWRGFVGQSQHQEVVIPENPQTIQLPTTCTPLVPQQEVLIPAKPEEKPETNKPVAPIQTDVTPNKQVEIKLPEPWSDLVTTLGMEKYFPSKLSLQKLRSLQIKHTEEQVATKEDLPWKVLEQLMLMNSQCREDEINKFAKTLKPKEAKVKRVFGKSRAQKAQPADRIPHPMDLILLLFTSSDHMLRQVLARKLFMCRLAIPFILPTAWNTVEMMLWPLRSIILEWKDFKESHEEALVNCKFNMVAFMRYGETEFSKSCLMNDVLSSPSHATFFHKGSPCGNEKRLVSNGTVEMTHFLPGGSSKDMFKDPALFFNLRGDACDYPVQHSVLLDLATVMVIFVDIGELKKASVQEKLKDTTKQKQQCMCFVLTDSKGHSESDMEELHELFSETVGDCLDDDDLVTTFNIDEGGGTENINTVIQDVRNVISKKMERKPEISLEQYALSLLNGTCVVDEISNDHCSAGKEVAKRVLSELNEVDYLQRKRVLLPKQGPSLTELGKLLRELHRTSALDKTNESSDSTKGGSTTRENLKSEMSKIRMEQGQVTRTKSFMDGVIELLKVEKETREFAIRFVQLELDSISRSHLPDLQSKKNDYWAKQAKEKENPKSVQSLKEKIEALEEDISAASLGWEHLMREVGQVYEASTASKDPSVDVSFLPELVAKQLFEGHPVELMNGDHGILPLAWVKAMFQSLSQLAGEKTIFVLSVVGVQSSGKSTMLNTMFGLEFAVSAGRCTRGIYAQLLPIKENQNLKFDFMLVLDSEGLRSQQKEQNYQHDNELATLVIGLSDIALVNMKGENVAEMLDVLQIVVYAFLRMKLADSFHKRKCMVIHQNVAAVGAQKKLADDRQKLEKKLNAMTEQASEAQGLPECITSFNQIIGFDSQHDVVYFPDLWRGDLPMATISQGYSDRAADTQQSILQDIQKQFTSSITIPDFITRVEDMWKGVLSDDFIFNFRNTLAAKAYLTIEEQCSVQTFKIEQELQEWVTNTCKVEIGNCKTQEDLNTCCEELKLKVKKQVNTIVTQRVNKLKDFVKNHPAKAIVDQWKEEKVRSLQSFGKTQATQTNSDLDNMKVVRCFELKQNHDSKAHEQEILKKATELAESKRGQDLSEEELHTQFEKLWENWTSHLPDKTTQSQGSLCVMSAFESILWDKFDAEGGTRSFNKQIEHTPLERNDRLKKLTKEDLTKDHIDMKGKLMTHIKSDCFDEASGKANKIMDTVMQRVEKICTQDVPFNNLHGRETIDLLWEEVAKHNKLPLAKAAFTIAPEFKALIAIHVTACAIPKYEQMNQRFEEQHGVEAKRKKYKRRVWRLFQNSVQDSVEATASGDFCEALKAKIDNYVSDKVKQSIPESIQRDLGNIKSDFIIKMLEDIAHTGSFTSFYSYASDPTKHAKAWLPEYCEKHLFTKRDGQTNYARIADHAAETVFAHIVSSVTTAIEAVSDLEETKQCERWIREIGANLKTMIPVDSSDLEKARTIKNFGRFQDNLKSDLKKMQRDIKTNIHKATAESVKGLDVIYKKIFQRLWGCREHCPFCKEPCTNTDPNHSSPHDCVQHKPSGVLGISTRNWIYTDQLYTETCNCFVASAKTFKCDDVGFQCRESSQCTPGLWNRVVGISHKYREYKKYLPNWNITPDAADEACEYWQWAMCYFQGDVAQKHSRKALTAPSSWQKVSEQDAIASLKKFR